MYKYIPTPRVLGPYKINPNKEFEKFTLFIGYASTCALTSRYKNCINNINGPLKSIRFFNLYYAMYDREHEYKQYLLNEITKRK